MSPWEQDRTTVWKGHHSLECRHTNSACRSQTLRRASPTDCGAITYLSDSLPQWSQWHSLRKMPQVWFTDNFPYRNEHTQRDLSHSKSHHHFPLVGNSETAGQRESCALLNMWICALLEITIGALCLCTVVDSVHCSVITGCLQWTPTSKLNNLYNSLSRRISNFSARQ